MERSIAMKSGNRPLPVGGAELSAQAARTNGRRELSAAPAPVKGCHRDLVVLRKPESRKARAIKSLRVHLSINLEKPDLAVVSGQSREGRSYLSANLAIAFAQSGLKTVLIDMNAWSPKLHTLFGLPQGPGLFELATGALEARDPFVPIDFVPRLTLLPAGTAPKGSEELAARADTTSLLRGLTQEYEVVLFDTPPGHTSSVADWVSDYCGQSLLLVRRSRSLLERTRSFKDRISARSKIAGLIMTIF